MHIELIDKRMNTFVFLKEYLSPLLAVTAGFLAYRHFTFLWKLLFLQVIVYVLTIKIVYEITPGLQTNSNHWFYNAYIILEIAFLCFAPYRYFKNSFFKSVLPLLFTFYLLIFCFQSYVNGFDHFTNFAFAAAGLVVTVIYGHILFIEFRNKKIHSFFITGNKIGEIGGKYIAKLIQKNDTITSIDVSSNQISDSGKIIIY